MKYDSLQWQSDKRKSGNDFCLLREMDQHESKTNRFEWSKLEPADGTE